MRWTYSFNPLPVGEDNEERNAPVNGYDCLSQTMIDGLLPSKNPLSPENIGCDIESGSSIHGGNPTIGRSEINQFRNHCENSCIGNDKSGNVIMLLSRFHFCHGFIVERTGVGGAPRATRLPPPLRRSARAPPAQAC